MRGAAANGRAATPNAAHPRLPGAAPLSSLLFPPRPSGPAPAPLTRRPPRVPGGAAAAAAGGAAGARPGQGGHGARRSRPGWGGSGGSAGPGPGGGRVCRRRSQEVEGAVVGGSGGERGRLRGGGGGSGEQGGWAALPAQVPAVRVPQPLMDAPRVLRRAQRLRPAALRRRARRWGGRGVGVGVGVGTGVGIGCFLSGGAAAPRHRRRPSASPAALRHLLHRGGH